MNQYRIFIVLSCLLISLLTSNFSPLKSQPLRYIYNRNCTIKIDGILDEECYKEFQPIRNFKIAGEPEKKCLPTRCWAFWSSEKLYFAYDCKDSCIIAASQIRDEFEVSEHDRVEVFLWSGDENDSYISLEIGAQSLVYDYSTRFYREYNASWSPKKWNYCVVQNPEGYRAEIEISAEDLQQFGLSLNEGAKLRVGLFRADYSTQDKDREPVWITWVDANGPKPDFHIPKSFGEFVLIDKKGPLQTFEGYENWDIKDRSIVLNPGDAGKPIELTVGEALGDAACVWIGKLSDELSALFTLKSGYVLLREDSEIKRFKKPALNSTVVDSTHWYGGVSRSELLASWEDILGKHILAKDTLNPDEIAALLPPITNGYQLLGSPLSGPCPLILRSGIILNGVKGGESILFDPGAFEPRVKNLLPVTGLLDEWLPVAYYTYGDGYPKFELTAFVSFRDRGSAPTVWIRLAGISKEGGIFTQRFWSAAYPQLQAVVANQDILEPAIPETFWKAFASTIYGWSNYSNSLYLPELPDQSLMRIIKGSLALSHGVFSGENPRYGAGEYGRPLHETFPPAIISVLETAFSYGERQWVEKLIDFWFNYCVDDDGTFCYWQNRNKPAASASEYGMLFWLINQIDRAYDANWVINHHLKKLEVSAYYLNSLRRPIDKTGFRLIHLGAEADNEKLENAYFSNNLWAVRGLKSLSELLTRQGQKGSAEHIRSIALDLEQDTYKALNNYAQMTEYGLLPPIHPEYSVLPLTLSSGLKKPVEVDENIWNDYNNGKEIAAPAGENLSKPQNLRENAYANYRYYLEMLSSGALPETMAEAIVKLRAKRGGELLGMTRFMEHLDDWPVAEWARYLLSKDYLKEYWLLLYSHITHHQERSTLTAYEQVNIDGKMRADACLPAQLVAPRMLSWAFAFEFPGDENLYLLRGIPQGWYTPGKKFGWNGLYASAGAMDIQVNSGEDEIEISLNIQSIQVKAPIIVQMNCEEKAILIQGQDCVSKIIGNKIYLKKSIPGKIDLVIKR